MAVGFGGDTQQHGQEQRFLCNASWYMYALQERLCKQENSALSDSVEHTEEFIALFDRVYRQRWQEIYIKHGVFSI